jgi:hypothetical protein
VRQNRREEGAQRSLRFSGVRARTGHDQVALNGVDADTKPLLHVGDQWLRLVRSLCGVDE